METHPVDPHEAEKLRIPVADIVPFEARVVRVAPDEVGEHVAALLDAELRIALRHEADPDRILQRALDPRAAGARRDIPAIRRDGAEDESDLLRIAPAPVEQVVALQGVGREHLGEVAFAEHTPQLGVRD